MDRIARKSEMAAKFNPFRPNNLVTPGMFVGRVDELRRIEKCLNQTRHDNPQSFLVLGERGIGKSSLLHYVDMVSRGEIEDFDGASFNYLTVSIDLNGCQTDIDIVKRMARSLRDSLADHKKAFEAVKGFWEWVTNWEILGVKYHRPDVELDLQEVLEELVGKLSGMLRAIRSQFDGALFLIDEADRPTSIANLGSILKYTSERLVRKGCNNVMFGLAGLLGLTKILSDSHESAPRLFDTMNLDPLEIQEREKIIDLGLEESNARNVSDTSITEEAKGMLASLSEGYPHFVQQFAYSAFDADEDDIIDVNDVVRGAFNEGGALSQLGDRFFKDMYHARISSDDYRRVLDAMAKHGDEWIKKKSIIAESEVSETNVGNALKALKAKEIILQDGTRRGYYRLPTRSFAVWINAFNAAREVQKRNGR